MAMFGRYSDAYPFSSCYTGGLTASMVCFIDSCCLPIASMISPRQKSRIPSIRNLAAADPFGSEGRFKSVTKSTSSLTNQIIDRILELSADAHIGRRMAAKDSPAFHNLTGAIGAYGKALELLVALQQWEEVYAIIGERELPESVTAPVN